MGKQRPLAMLVRSWLQVAVAALALLQAFELRAATWIEQVQADLTCTGLASEVERASLAAPWLPTPLTASAVGGYFRGAAQDRRQAEFRYLTMLAAIAWWADLINDQGLGSAILVDVGLRAERAAASGDLLSMQVARCARARLIDSQLELDHAPVVRDLANSLARMYPAAMPAEPVADWPLLLASRSMQRSTTAGNELSARALSYSGVAAQGGQLERSRRWQAAAKSGPLAPDDPEASFENLLTRSREAESRQQFEEMASLQQSAFKLLGNLRGLQRYPMPFYRQALDELAALRDEDLGTVATKDPQFAGSALASYLGMRDKLLAQSQDQFVAHAREQLFFQYKVDNVLHGLAELSPAMPRSAAEIADTAFQLAQLRTYGRLTLATLSAELDRSAIDPAARPSVERFFTLSTQTAVWLRALYSSIRVAPDAAPPPGEALWKVFFTLDVFNEETGRQFDRYVALVRQKAPRVADLATPRPQRAEEFRRRLRTGEALVATLVTPRDLYVWAVTAKGLTFIRRQVPEREVAAKVQRLRSSLMPLPGADTARRLAPFDAAAAHELYQWVFAPLERALEGITDVVWYGHGPLGAVPPAVLVTAPPAKPKLSTPTEFGATKFLVDRYAFAVLADLSLFTWHRDQPTRRAPGDRFLGVGAPLLTAAEVAGGPRAKSYELASGMAGSELAKLPKLAESVDEMKGLAGVAGASNSTLWLGPEATEKRFVGDALRGYRTIALATHGFLPGEVRDVPEPALMLVLDPGSRDRFDGLLTSREIAALQLDADLVILSACNTASGDGRARSEAFTGLSQAFFTAGTRTVMVSHWPVMSGAAVALSVGTYDRAKRQGSSLSRSLQQAMQATRGAGAASTTESHPSYWGPFVIAGDGR